MELTPQQELFCRYYAQNTELFGNATLSYAEAYDYKLDERSREQPILARNTKGEPTEFGDSEYKIIYDQCSSHGSRLIRNGKIQERVRVLLNEFMRDDVIDAQLLKVIVEGKDQDKVAAIKEYNKLKQRIIDKQDITSGGKPIPIYGGQSTNIPGHNSNKEDIPTDPAN